MMKLIEKIVNVSTGDETIVEHTLSADEVAEIEAKKAALEAANAEAAAKEAAKAAVLEKLGLTADEAAALLGL